MYRQGIADFPYYLGTKSLAEVATRADRVCVLNILGGESRTVTPTSHAFSGGNVVFGTSPGRKGQVLKTPAGDIPVFNNVREGLAAGLSFNVGVVYLPPSGVRDGVAELIRVNDALEKIVIITEKVAVHDAREIRAMAQANGIDIVGGNCLGVADSWNRVRIGGALGGDHPEESLLKGSVAIFSNSGGFTTTIAQYLATEGWGTTTLISSGKDVYIHYAARDFAYALRNDDRSKAAVLYAEPGGYYEHGVDFGKPVVACVVGRWKSKLTRAVGHAGAMAGTGDRAEDKEGWFMEAFGVDGLFTPEHPLVSAKGAVVTNIAHIPAALTAVMKLNGVTPDFPSTGSLALKPWIANDQGIALPPELALAAVPATEPYATQIAALRRQVGAVIARQSMKDKSGASVMDPKSQVTSVHGHSVLDLALEPLEANFALPLVHEIADAHDRAMLDVAVAAEVNLVGDPILVAADAARDAGNAPNAVMAAAAAIVGPKRVERVLACTRRLIDLFAQSGAGRRPGRGYRHLRHHHRRSHPDAVPRDAGRGGGSAARGDARGGQGARRQVGVPEVPGRPRRPAVARRDPRRDLADHRLGALDAQTHLAADRRDAALVSAPLRRDGGGDDSRPSPPARVAARHPARRALRAMDHGRSLLSRHDRQEADEG